MTEVFFSIVIPTYNRGDVILNTIRSVLSQTYSNFEIIVVDDGSTDDTADKIRSIADHRLRYVKIVNSERGAARNKGINLCKGRYVTFLDSDDILFPEHLQHVRVTLEAHAFPVLYHQAYQIGNGKKIFNDWNVAPHENLAEVLLTVGNVLSCMGVFIDKSILDKFRFNEDRDLAGMEDWELWIRLVSRFGIVTNGRITSMLIQHPGRSVEDVDRVKLEGKIQRLVKYVFEDEIVREKYAHLKNKFLATVYSYLSLHLSASKRERQFAWRYFKLALRHNPATIFRRRAIAIVRNILRGFFR